MKLIYAFIAILYLIHLSSFGQQNIANCSSLTIDDFPTTACGSDPWTQNGLTLTLPFNQVCHFINYGNYTSLRGTLIINLSPLNWVSQIDITVANSALNGLAQIKNASGLVGETDFSNGPNTTYTVENPLNLPVDRLNIYASDVHLVSITIYYDCAPDCEPNIQVESEQGDVYINDACYGTILTSPSGNCFRVRVNNDGTFITETVTCP